MAISLSKTILGGQVTVTYHRIKEVPPVVNTEAEQTVYVWVAEFANEQAAKVDVLPELNTSSYPVQITKSEIIAFIGNIYALFYSKLMQLPAFQGATEI